MKRDVSSKPAGFALERPPVDVRGVGVSVGCVPAAAGQIYSVCSKMAQPPQGHQRCWIWAVPGSSAGTPADLPERHRQPEGRFTVSFSF